MKNRTQPTTTNHFHCFNGLGTRCDIRHRTRATAETHARILNRRYRRSFGSGYPTGPTTSGYFRPCDCDDCT